MHSRHSMTRQLNNDNGLQAQRTERQHLTAKDSLRLKDVQ